MLNRVSLQRVCRVKVWDGYGNYGIDSGMRKRADTHCVAIVQALLLSTAVIGALPAFGADQYSEGVVLFNQKRYDEAKQRFDEALKSDRSARKLYYAALSRLYGGDASGGAQLMREIVRAFPQSVEAGNAAQYLSGLTKTAVSKNPVSETAPGNVSYQASRGTSESLPDQVSIPFRRGLGGHLYVEGALNGRPMTMIFDTGAEGCAFGQNHLDAAAITQKGESAGYARGVGGAVKISQMEADITVSNLKRRIPIMVQERLPMPPLLGETFFAGYTYAIDNRAGMIRFTKKGVNSNNIGYDTIAVPYSLSGRNMLVTLEIDGHPLQACFDTGASGVVLSAADAASAQLKIPEDAEVVGSRGVGGVVPSYLFKVRSIKLSSIQKSNFPIRVLMGSLPYALIGQDFFGDRKFTIDQEHRVIHFSR